MKVKVSFIGLMDMLKFKHLKRDRLEAIRSTEIKPLKHYPVNDLADYYHPLKQYLKIAEIKEENKDTKSFVLVPDGEKSKKLAFFKAGSYISLYFKVGDSIASRAYAISSSPKEALEGKYRITIKRKVGGFLSSYMLDHAKVGDELFSTDPAGFLTYNSIRDAKNVIALAGGTGITPFISMANAIKDGIEDFNLTILYGVNKLEDAILKDELESIEKATSKVKVIYVIKDEEVKGAEKGLLTYETIKKYLPSNDEKYSIFISGPNAMFDFLEGELKKLNIENKFIRKEKSPETLNVGDKVFDILVHMEDETFTIKAKQDETVLNALERSGIVIRSKCHLGGCGFCRSRILKGEIATTKLNSQAEIDKKLHFFHPCCSYPMSDMEIEVYKYWFLKIVNFCGENLSFLRKT